MKYQIKQEQLYGGCHTIGRKSALPSCGHFNFRKLKQDELYDMCLYKCRHICRNSLVIICNFDLEMWVRVTEFDFRKYQRL